MLAPINQPTGDGRRIAVGGFTHRPLPLPLKWQRVDADGHDDSVVVGSLERIEIDEPAGAVWGEGELFDDASPTTTPRLAEDVAEAKMLLDKKVIGPSVDPGSAQAVTVIKGDDEPLSEQAMERYWMQHGKLPETELLFTGYEIAAATLVPVPAFAQCRPFELLGDSTTAAVGREALLASCPALPPLDPALFRDPELKTYTPLTRRDLGNGWTHVFGHVASHDVCHVGIRDVCTTAPYSDNDYQPFHRYSTTRDGHPLPVMAGRLTGGFGQFENHCACHRGNDDHACGNVSFGAAIAHHDRMETLAYVCTGEDEANDAVWFSGVEAPEITPEGRALLARRKVSGDWREYGDAMELTEVLVLARREPGFPLPRVSMFNGRQRSLTAAGVIRPDEQARLSGTGILPLPGQGGPIDYDRLGAAVAQHLMAAAAPAITAAVRADWKGVPVADGNPEWDKGAAIRRLSAWADGDIEGKYARAFVWRDPEADPELQGAYKLPIADVIDGKLAIIPNAVRNALARLSQTEGLSADEEEARQVLEGLLDRVNADGESVTAASPEGGHSGAMVALRMSDADADRLAVTGGLPPEELHLTLAYLGEASDISPEARERMTASFTELARSVGGPLSANGFAVSAFNPGINERPTAIVMGVSGEALADLQARTREALEMCEGYEMPEQHSPWHAHTTLAYDDDLSKIAAYADRVGPLTFDRLRLAFAGDVIDIPLEEIIAVDTAEQDERDPHQMYAARTAAVAKLRAARAVALAEQIADAAALADE
jgi:2'-5' RNA ligase